MKKDLRRIKIVESGGLSISLDYLTIGMGSPKTLIISGVHGTERTGNLVIAKLLESLPEFKGTLSVLPLSNPLGYAMETRQEPLSGLDLNRQFTGKNNGQPALMIASAIVKLAEKYDFVIDLHNYPTGGVLQVGYSANSDQKKLERLVSLLKPDIIRTSHTEKSWKLEGSLSGMLQNKGVPYIIVEMPSHRDVLTDQVSRVVAGIKTHIIGNEEDVDFIYKVSKIPHVQIKTVKSPQGGVFYSNPKIKLMDKIIKGKILGVLVDIPSGRKIEIKCPYDGVVCEKITQNEFPAVAGNTLYGIGVSGTK